MGVLEIEFISVENAKPETPRLQIGVSGECPYFTAWGTTTGKVADETGEYPLEVIIQPPEGERFPSNQQQPGLNGIEGSIPDAPEVSKPYEVTIVVANLEKIIYDYYKTFWDLDDWQSNTGNFLPNFREPQKLASNIQGGIGIFACYSVSTCTVIVDE